MSRTLEMYIFIGGSWDETPVEIKTDLYVTHVKIDF